MLVRVGLPASAIGSSAGNEEMQDKCTALLSRAWQCAAGRAWASTRSLARLPHASSASSGPDVPGSGHPSIVLLSPTGCAGHRGRVEGDIQDDGRAGASERRAAHGRPQAIRASKKGVNGCTLDLLLAVLGCCFLLPWHDMELYTEIERICRSEAPREQSRRMHCLHAHQPRPCVVARSSYEASPTARHPRDAPARSGRSVSLTQHRSSAAQAAADSCVSVQDVHRRRAAGARRHQVRGRPWHKSKPRSFAGATAAMPPYTCRCRSMREARADILASRPAVPAPSPSDDPVQRLLVQAQQSIWASVELPLPVRSSLLTSTGGEARTGRGAAPGPAAVHARTLHRELGHGALRSRSARRARPGAHQRRGRLPRRPAAALPRAAPAGRGHVGRVRAEHLPPGHLPLATSRLATCPLGTLLRPSLSLPRPGRYGCKFLGLLESDADGVGLWSSAGALSLAAACSVAGWAGQQTAGLCVCAAGVSGTAHRTRAQCACAARRHDSGGGRDQRHGAVAAQAARGRVRRAGAAAGARGAGRQRGLDRRRAGRGAALGQVRALRSPGTHANPAGADRRWKAPPSRHQGPAAALTVRCCSHGLPPRHAAQGPQGQGLCRPQPGGTT